MKVLTIIGARPQFIKAATVSRVFSETMHQEILLHTGQHYDENMSDIFFDELNIPRPKYNLGIGSGMHGVQTGEMLAAIEEIILEELPDWVLVYGDTNSTLAGALAAVKQHFPIAHVEAGLRSFNKQMPEEINRVLTDHCSDLLFTPTKTAVDNLLNQGIRPDVIVNVGDVMYDAALYYGDKAEAKSDALNSLSLESGQYVLTTIHRAENTDNVERLRNIFDALSVIGQERPVILPLHPRTAHALERAGIAIAQLPIRVVSPLGYLDMVMLEKHAAVVVTDSGGVQKEAFFHQTPCITLRDETEWIELVELGCNRLAPPSSSETIVGAIRSAQAFPFAGAESPYGHGDAAKRIVSELESRTR